MPSPRARNLKLGAGLVGALAITGAAWRGRIYARSRAEIRAAERAMRASEARFRSLIEATAAIVWTTDPAGEFIQPQPSWQAFTGQPFEEMRGRGWLDAIHPEDRCATVRAWQEAAETSTAYEIEHRLRRRDGTYIDMQVRAAPVRAEGGMITEWVGVHNEITHRKANERALTAAKEAAEEAAAAKSQFIANMSHELRTPLSAVIGYAEMLEEDVETADPEETRADLGKITANARHLLDLINAVLDLSKIEAGKDELYLERIDAGDLIRSTADTAAALVARNGNQLVLVVPEALGAIRSDALKLRQCLLNLLSNAAKFTEGGTITLAGERAGDMLVLSVSDTGIGMTAEQIDRLFERFVQADNSVTRRYGGSGLGLALTRAFAERLGGSIEVESKPGAGSVFRLRIPIETREAAPAPAEPPRPPEAGRPTILVIDDEPAMRELLERFLARQGFAVLSAPDGEQGLAIARATKPNAIMLDVMMPEVDGWSVLGALKADAGLATIPVVMITASRERGLALSLGAVDHLQKPVDWQRLKALLGQYRGSDPHRAVLAGADQETVAALREALAEDGWTAETSDLEHLLTASSAEPPQLVLIDAGAGADLATVLPRLRRRLGPAVPIVVISDGLRSATQAAIEAADAETIAGSDIEAVVAELKALLTSLDANDEPVDDGGRSGEAVAG